MKKLVVLLGFLIVGLVFIVGCGEVEMQKRKIGDEYKILVLDKDTKIPIKNAIVKYYQGSKPNENDKDAKNARNAVEHYNKKITDEKGNTIIENIVAFKPIFFTIEAEGYKTLKYYEISDFTKSKNIVIFIEEVDTIDEEEIQRRNGIVYKKNDKKPFTGKVVFYHEDGQKEIEAYLKEGKFHGKSVSYYENGKKKTEANYKNGEMYGRFLLWDKKGKGSSGYWKDGKAMSEKNFKDGLGISAEEGESITDETVTQNEKGNYSEIEFIDLKLDIDSLYGKKIKTRAYAMFIAGTLILQQEMIDTNSIQVDIKNISREEKKYLLTKIPIGGSCCLTVYGRVGEIAFGFKGIIADKIEWE